MMRMVKGMIRRIAIVWIALVLLLGGLCIADYLIFPAVVHPRGQNLNLGRNGLWLGSKWYMAKVSEQDFQSVATLLKKEQIAYAYFHCKDINAQGNLRIPSESGAKQLVAKLHQLCPGIKIMVWMGALGTEHGGEVDISKEAVRVNMANCVSKLVNTAGFDGVQWDLEPVRNESVNFLDLLDRTRQNLPKECILSLAAPPDWPGIAWNSDYIEKVSRHCDQIALMAYDTWNWLPRFYVAEVESLLTKYANAIYASGAPCKLVVGVPTYEDVTPAHHAHAECLEMALVGLKNAMSNPAVKRQVIDGIAPYAEYTTDIAEWKIYDRYWLEEMQGTGRSNANQ